ncbi:MAG TPA: TIGR03118 family protein [Bryobacteraceae bacterium]|jgi:uncharacterized protein (TIGR03118 family)
MKTGFYSFRPARIFLAAAIVSMAAQAATNFTQTNLVADVAGAAANTDPNLVGTWGMSSSPTSPLWVSNTSNGTSTVYNTNTAGLVTTTVVNVPPSATRPGLLGLPTGQVWNGLAGFAVATGHNASFIFATLDGTISGFSGAVGTTAVLMVDNGSSGAAYTGLAIGSSAIGPTLYAANFAAGTIDVFDKTFAPAQLWGNFTDPDLPPGFSPSNIQRYGRRLYVTYAMSNGSGGFVSGPGTGLVDVFNTNGQLEQRLVPGHASMNAPWGVAVAGPNFGVFSYAVLVANFGDGSISAFDANNGNFLGTMMDGQGNNIAIDGLWGIQYGNGGNGGDPTALYFVAAPSYGAHGLIGTLKPMADSNTP